MLLWLLPVLSTIRNGVENNQGNKFKIAVNGEDKQSDNSIFREEKEQQCQELIQNDDFINKYGFCREDEYVVLNRAIYGPHTRRSTLYGIQTSFVPEDIKTKFVPQMTQISSPRDQNSQTQSLSDIPSLYLVSREDIDDFRTKSAKLFP
jgi:hypothetical protein